MTCSSCAALSLFLAACFLPVASFAQSAAKPINVRDLHALERISQIQVSPDGQRVCFVLRTTDFDANRGRTNLWMCNIDGSVLRRLTTHPEGGASNPRWAADGGAIYFISSRDDSSQIWRIAADGGEAEQVTRLPLDVESFTLSRNGKLMALNMAVFPDASPADTKKRLDEKKQQKATGQLYDKLFVRHWDAWKDGRRSHIFVLPVGGMGVSPVPADSVNGRDARSTLSPEAVDLMKGMDADAPSRPFGDADEYTFTPDGKAVVFACRNVGREEAWSTRFDLHVAPVDGAAPPKVITPGNKATITQPVFSPDGRTLAYLAMTRPGYEADRMRIVLRSWPDGEPKLLTEKWDRSPQKIVWSGDGKTIYAFADNLGQRSIFAVSAADGAAKAMVEQGHATELGVAGDRVVYGLNSLKSPVQIHTVAAAGGSPTQITKINGEKLAELKLGEPEQFDFVGWNDEKVYGYIVKPVDFDAAKKYPIAFLIHGGPQGSFGNDWHYRWNPQLFAAAGYAAVMVDFHGSTGYGQAFTDAITGHWGDRPLEDLQKGLAAALAKYPWMNGEKVAALGASYGGYMINWIAGNWPDRFRCLVCHDGNLDEQFAYFDTEELWFPEWEHGGTPWEKPENFAKANPIDFVKNWKTPMLVIHGGKDYRVVYTHGIATFTALQRRGIPSKFLFFPDENHWVLKPANGILWYDTVLGWMDEWCKK
ncbi:Prolyl tripeptidyl peptidase precursor [Phycisphaerae bacterium RAS1]|nr:Prolyl tripeptidyl peptidase precursor [Phycisphaerae bacterium RAS1]